ncbi:MAG: MarR family transcriptional regulator [Alphaproteobacteria bacterium]|nr:MarR family transcriptional regulator [Alphaproteobacteria bacterium]
MKKKSTQTPSTSAAQTPYPVSEPLDLAHHMPFLLSEVARMLSIGASRTFQRQFGLGVREWRVLAILGDQGPVSAAAMVGPAAFDKATVSRAINTLEANGHVERLPDENDGRKQLVRLTEAGVKLHDRIVPIAKMRAKVLESALTAQERALFFATIEKLKTQVEWLDSEERNNALLSEK